MMSEKISVVVCTINRASLTDCLKSIYQQDYNDIEVIVISPDERGVKKILNDSLDTKNLESTKFVQSPKANVSIQRNLGIMNSSSDIVCFIDDDAVAEKSWVTNLIKHYSDKKVMAVGGKINPKFKGSIPDELKELPDSIFKGFLGETLFETDETKRLDMPLLWGSNISFRKEIFDRIGFFNEELGRAGDKLLCEEEIDIQSKILDKGYDIIYEPSSVVIHYVGKNKLNRNYFIKRAFWQGYSEVIKIKGYSDFRKNMGNIRISHLRYVNNIKFLELLFELESSPNLKNSVEKSYRLGRIVGLSCLVNR